MNWKSWYAKRIVLTLLAVFCIVLSSVALSYLSKETSSVSVMKSIKVFTNSMMTELEHEHKQLNNETSSLHSYLAAWNTAHNSSLLVAWTDGTVVYDSRKNDSGLKQSSLPINPRYELDFALRQSTEGTAIAYHISFPIVDAASQLLVGYAQFALPQSALEMPQTSYGVIKFTGWSFLILGLLLLLYSLLSIGRYVSSQYVQPVIGLKAYAEAILKGDYEQRAEWTARNEASELYAVFDQMRDEIRSLQMQRTSHNQAHKELISNLSHDLKTPLTTIRAYVDSIREGVCPDLPTAIIYLNVVHSNIHKMTVLVDDLLLHALRDLEQIAVHPTEQYSADVLRPMIQNITHYIKTTGITCEPPASYPNVLLAIDSVRLEQVLANLVANALKHTATGDKITLHVEENLEQHTLELTVADTGSGISPADMPFIFERYYQGQAAATSNQASQPRHGVGLGLSICKHIVEAHGGSISFHSRLNEGTTFRITLPLS